jgi:hypothetical protein
VLKLCLPNQNQLSRRKLLVLKAQRLKDKAKFIKRNTNTEGLRAFFFCRGSSAIKESRQKLHSGLLRNFPQIPNHAETNFFSLFIIIFWLFAGTTIWCQPFKLKMETDKH